MSGDKTNGSTTNVDLPRPGRLVDEMRKVASQKSFSDSSSSSSNSSASSDEEIEKAATVAAEHIGGDVKKIQSDLIGSLQRIKEGGSPLDILSSMKVERTKARTSPLLDSNGQASGKRRMDFQRGSVTEQFMKFKKSEDYKLYDGKRLGIFEESTNESVDDYFTLLQKKYIESLENDRLATNAWDELEKWTKEKKTWKYPIDNDQDWEEEMNVGFHEHVFIDRQLQNGFPKSGPVRHFMELVCAGLSKNHHMTVKEKYDHIDWFRNYFEERMHMLS